MERVRGEGVAAVRRMRGKQFMKKRIEIHTKKLLSLSEMLWMIRARRDFEKTEKKMGSFFLHSVLRDVRGSDE